MMGQFLSAVFITFPGNCKKALTFYQTCFGGQLQFETFEKEILGATNPPVVSGSLVSNRITIHGSDLVHNEGRRLGNYISIYLHFKNEGERKKLTKKLQTDTSNLSTKDIKDQKLVELTDAFDVRWILGI